MSARVLRKSWTRRVGGWALAGVFLLAAGCGAAGGPAVKQSLDEVRLQASKGNDGDSVGRWLLAELVTPGGDPARARAARKRLDEVPNKGMYAALARGMYDGAHGAAKAAAFAYLDVLTAARGSKDAAASLLAWYATNHLLGLAPNTSGLWGEARPEVEGLIRAPGSIGWRARGELVEWWTEEARAADLPGILETSAEQHGCVRGARIAGPFGHDVAADRRRVFAAEKPGPWPRLFTPDPGVHELPRVLRTERRGCQLRADEPVPSGVYYVETYLDLPEDRELLVAVQGAYRVLVDDAVVLERDTRVWGVWTNFGVKLRLARGRHRVLARVGSPETSVRILAPDGTPARVGSSADPAGGYAASTPVVVPGANELDRFVQGGNLAPVDDDLLRFIGAFLSHVEGQNDVGALLLEPLVEPPSRATALVLSVAANIAEKDPIFPDSDRHDLARDLRARSIEKDPALFWPALWLALDQAEKKGLSEAVGELRKLSDKYPEVPEILQGLLDLYERLGWKAERLLAARELGARFPDNPRILRAVMDVLDEQRDHKAADKLAARILKLDPDSDVRVERALARRDYDGALAALRAFIARRPERKELADRLAEVLTSAGQRGDALALLDRAVAKRPQDVEARLRLADARLSSGDSSALRNALSDAILAGSSTSELLSAFELVEGVTELEPYRLDGRRIVEEYEASGDTMEGTAARVLDYSAIWVHPDGSSRMLEHELIRVQSQEAIGKLAEQRVPDGLVLKLRVLKQGGQVLEPEFVAGKPTVTMPHLEVGDYIETETITSQAGDGQFGAQYVGPHWFFREADIGYARSEIVIVTPKDKAIVVEQHGQVPPPTVTDNGPLTVRRWRVDRSPAAASEPGSPPVQEFLPSLRVGWGVSLADHVRRLADAVSDELPRDPRLVRIAEQIARAGGSESDRARQLYRWVVANVEDGRESDGRRAVVGKSGNRTHAFLYLCRCLGISAELAVVRDSLSPRPVGPIDETESFDDVVVRLGSTRPQWITLRDKFAPFGYLPGPLRGQPAYRLIPGTPAERTSLAGGQDGILYEASGELKSDGSAELELVERFLGKAAIGLRSGLEKLPEAQRKDVVESRLLASALPGARLESLRLENQADLDQPMVLRMKVTVRDFARRRGGSLVLSPPFAVRISQLTGLPYRQTPLLLPDPTYAVVKVSLKLPERAKAQLGGPVEVKDGTRKVVVRDRQDGKSLVLERVIDIPAGRIQPSEYQGLQRFARDADDATLRDISIRVEGL